MENEIMNYEDEVMETEVDTVEVENEGSGMSTGLVVLIGAGLAAATVAAVTLGKKVWSKIKKNKELRKPDDDEFIEVTEEDIMNVTK